MLWKVYSRTARTPWIELGVYENETEARKRASEILARGGEEVMIEPQNQSDDKVPAAL